MTISKVGLESPSWLPLALLPAVLQCGWRGKVWELSFIMAVVQLCLLLHKLKAAEKQEGRVLC